MRVFLKVDETNFKQIVDFYYETLMQIAATSKNYSFLLQESPEVKKKVHSYIENMVSSQKNKKIEFDYNLKLSNQNQKFVKTAQGWIELAKIIGVEGMKEIIGKGMGADDEGILGKFESLFSKFPFLKDVFNYLKNVSKNALSQLTDIELLKKWMLANKTLDVAHGKERFSPSAYEHLFETKTGPRGIDGSYVSKGAYELPSYKMYDQLENAKQTSPELFKNKYEYYDAPEFQYEKERLKPKTFFDDRKLYEKKPPKPSDKLQPLYTKPSKEEAKNSEASGNNKFIKVSQVGNKVPLVSKEQADQISKLFPKWSMDDISREVQAISLNPSLDDTDKQKEYEQIIAKYAKSIEPLHKYIQGLTKQK